MKSLLRFCIVLIFFFPVVFYGQQQLENPGFENWENIGMSLIEPVDWSTTKTADNPAICQNAPVTYERIEDTNVFAGNYSLKLYNILALPSLVATGAITSGRLHGEYDLTKSYAFTQRDDPAFNTPFTGRPDSLTGWFKFFPQNDDVAQFKVVLHVDSCTLPDNGTKPNWVSMAVYITERGVTYNTWTRFSVPFEYFNDNTPEYALTVINSGDSITADDGSYLLVDELKLIYPASGISDHSISESFLITAGDRLEIRLEPEEEYLHQWFYLIDVAGQTILSKRLENGQVIIPASIAQGVYVAVVNGRNRQYVQKVLIQ